MPAMRVAAFQFDVARGEVEQNLDSVLEGVRAAHERGARLIVLPEMWPTSFSDAGDSEALDASDAAVARVAELSAELGIAVSGTAYHRGAAGAAPTNRLWIHDGGEALLAYDKVHLFSPAAENVSFSAGQELPQRTRLDEVSVTGVTCYDLRFGEVVRGAVAGEAELLLCPAQWPVVRAGHWSALAVGRAVEHQCFVVAVNRTGTAEIGRRRLKLEFAGNSLIVDPHGKVLAEGRGEAGLVVADLDLDVARRVRKAVPIERDRRAELYRGWS